MNGDINAIEYVKIDEIFTRTSYRRKNIIRIYLLIKIHLTIPVTRYHRKRLGLRDGSNDSMYNSSLKK
jgi:hypothetical protein